MIMDPDQPGADFLLRYRTLYKMLGPFPLLVLGSRSHPAMKAIAWEPVFTHFLDGPQPILQLEALLAEGNLKPEQPAETPKAIGLFHGLHGVQLSDILQMLCLSLWTGEIRVHGKMENSTGTLTLDHGHLHAASCGSLEAEQACYAMLAWKQCEFHFLEKTPTGKRSLYAGWEAILMEAACRADEYAHVEAC